MLGSFQPPVQAWFSGTFAQPTEAQRRGWPPVVAGLSTLLLAPTGSGKTLAAFLAALDRIMFGPVPPREQRLRLVYVSPLKALGVDIERNLRAPIAGIQAASEQSGMGCHTPAVLVRSGDTPTRERARFVRAPADVLITTPESLYLLLTSRARETLRWVETVIVDEIHSLAATKRGAHLSVSLERLEALRTVERPLQRIGLSATQRPLEEVARLLGGGVVHQDAWEPRPVTIVDAGARKPMWVSVEVPVDDLSRLTEGQNGDGGRKNSLWPALHVRLVQLIRDHRSTMVFVNNRRLAERLASSINEEAGEELALAHHGSVARDQRLVIEERLKAGRLRAIVATSSLELGIDMGAVDLVVQIEAPPSVASGLQRVGRAGHTVGALSKGVVFPKHRGDLLACAACAHEMHHARVEATSYPRNPLDVVAQQIVAMVATERWHASRLYETLRGAAPLADLPWAAFEGVLDMLSGRYPSDEFAGLRARITWDRTTGELRDRRGARQLAVANGGTIPDRGLYGVFLSDADARKSRRVGELDEEMVFESRVGEVFLLGASSWRIEEITHDRVLVSPAPGEPGKMPFWRGDGPGRSFALGQAIGALARVLAEGDAATSRARLLDGHGLDERAAKNLVAYVQDQLAASGAVPSDRTVLLERFVDEVGDYRVCLLTPFGSRVHAPWAIAAVARLREDTGSEVDVVWSDDGIVFRLPEQVEPPATELFLPVPEEAEERVVRALPGTALFAAHFRENAARALLLPRRRPGQRSPLWAQRRRAADLLRVAARFPSFPILLETYRECLRDVFDLPALLDVLRRISTRRVRVVTVDSRSPSPFAASQLFSYVANFIYDGDAPLAERRAQVLAIDHTRLRELLGEAELRELLAREALEAVEVELSRGAAGTLRHADDLHDLLLAIGDLSTPEIESRCRHREAARDWIDELVMTRRIVEVGIAGGRRYVAVEDASRYRDALGIALPTGLPAAFLEPVADALGDLVSRFARTHGPFSALRVAERFGLGMTSVLATLERLAAAGRIVEGAFLPGGTGREWCDAQVLRRIKQSTMARLRREVEPVDPATLTRFLVHWHGVDQPRRGGEALVDAIERLQGVPLPVSDLLNAILPGRVRDFAPADLDLLCAQGEVTWRGIEPIGPRDGRVALYLGSRMALLAPVRRLIEDPLSKELLRLLAERGAMFFNELLSRTGAFGPDLLGALWEMVWAGVVSNDTLLPLRSRLAAGDGRVARVRPGLQRALPGSEGRWSLLQPTATEQEARPETERRVALAEQLLMRHGVVTRETIQAELAGGGFARVYPVLRAMEEAGRVRRGYFVAGLGAMQFARAGVDESLREFRQRLRVGGVVVLAATDPANPFGSALPWPAVEPRLGRTAGARVFLWDGALVAYLGRTWRALTTFLPDHEPARSQAAHEVASALVRLAHGARRRALLVATIDGANASESLLASALLSVGFSPGARGLLWRASPSR